jgi:hypothetical protein
MSSTDLCQAEAARHEASVARELAAQREAEAEAAHTRELVQLKRAEVGDTRMYVCMGDLHACRDGWGNAIKFHFTK